MDRSWMPTVAGILDILAGVVGVCAFIALSFAGHVVGNLPDGDEFPLPAVAGLLTALAFGYVVIAILAIVGGAFALQRRRWSWTLIGSIAATLCFPPLGIPSIILTILAEQELTESPEPAAET